MTKVTNNIGNTTGNARRARGGRAGLCYICALGLTICSPLSTLAHAQVPKASKEARPTVNQAKTMTDLTTVEVPLHVRATGAETDNESIRPFRFRASDADLADLRRRILATRWPEKEPVADHSQGVPLATMQKLARYWTTEYDWRKLEARLKALPQFITTIDGLDIHFIHIRSKHENALPIIVTHGWPGSITEQLKIVDPLINPTAHGGTASDAFHVVIRRCPDTGFLASRPRPVGDRSASPAPGLC